MMEGKIQSDMSTNVLMRKTQNRSSEMSPSALKCHCGGRTAVFKENNLLTPVLSTCPLHANSGCGKERRILIGPW